MDSSFSDLDEAKDVYAEQSAFQKDLINLGNIYIVLSTAVLSGVVAKLSGPTGTTYLTYVGKLILIGSAALFFAGIFFEGLSFIRGSYEFVADPEKDGPARAERLMQAATKNYEASKTRRHVLILGVVATLLGILVAGIGFVVESFG